MEAPSQFDADTIVVTQSMPLPIRILVGSAGAFVCIFTINDLFPALWPPSVLTLFFGLLAFGGVSIGLLFLAGALFGPNQSWEIHSGTVTIGYELRGQKAEKLFRAADFERIEIEETSRDSGPNVFALVCYLPKSASFDSRAIPSGIFAKIIASVASLSLNVRDRFNGIAKLTSPSFPSRTEAERALARLRG